MSLDTLGLSTRARNCLRRVGLRTVAEVAALTDEQLLNIRNLGILTLAEIREKLTIYLDSNPLPEQGQLSESPLTPKLAAPTEPEPVPPLVDPALLARAAQIPLDDISIERLALPTRWGNQFHRRGIESVGELARQPADAVDQDPSVGKQLERYLTWLVEQDEATWADEVAGQGISLRSLGAVTLISEARYRLTHFGEVEAARVGHSLPDSPFTSDTALPEISPSTDIGWLDAAL